MTIVQKRKILERIVVLEKDIEELKRARTEIGTCGYASASLSSTGGSKSYTRLDLDKITNLINSLIRELNQYMNLIGCGSANTISTIQTVYS